MHTLEGFNLDWPLSCKGLSKWLSVRLRTSQVEVTTQAGWASDFGALSCNNKNEESSEQRSGRCIETAAMHFKKLVTYHSLAGQQCFQGEFQSPWKTVWTSPPGRRWPQGPDLHTQQHEMLYLQLHLERTTHAAPQCFSQNASVL